jgi:hypothetical protein
MFDEKLAKAHRRSHGNRERLPWCIRVWIADKGDHTGLVPNNHLLLYCLPA